MTAPFRRSFRPAEGEVITYQAVRLTGATSDFGSRIDGFVGHCLTFCDVTVFDIRPLTSSVAGLEFVQADVTKLHNVATGSIPSLSSLHALEHIGLGRYGDDVDPDGYQKAIAELQRVAAAGSPIYVGVPIRRERVEFSRHRVFDPQRIVMCSPSTT